MKKTLILTSIISLSILLTSCGDNQEKNKTSKVTPKKNTLVYAQISEGKSLDPQDSTDQYSQNVTTQIYDRLIEIDETNGNLIPGLADSWEKLDDKTLLLHLNTKAKFHNGEDFTAKDVKFTLERAKSLPKVGHLYKLIDTIDIIDDDTVKIVTSEPFAPLVNHLSHKSAAIISEKYFAEKDKDYFLNPIGTGAYKYNDWSMGEKITLTANKDYFKGSPSIETVIIKAIPEENSKVIGLETGEIDIASTIQTIGRTTIINGDYLTFMERPSVSTSYIGLNTRKGVLQDKEIRRAIAMGIDRESVIKALIDGDVKIAGSFLAPVVFGYSDDVEVLEYNPEKAKEILNGKNIKLVYATSNSQLNAQIAEVVQAQLKEVGVDVEIQTLEWGAFLTATANGDLDMFAMGWGPSTSDGDYGLYPNFHSKQLGAAGNRTYYSNATMDKLLEDARSEMDVEKRKNLYIEATKIINEDVPLIPMYYSNTTVGVSNNLVGVEATSYPLFYKYSFKD